jgi:hypothetical protein
LFRKRWYEYPENKIGNSSIDFSKSNRLYISSPPDADSCELQINCIERILTIAQIYHLEICFIYFNTLIQILAVLPELNSLKIHSIVFDKPRMLSLEENDVVDSILNGSKITKIYLGKINYIEEIFVLMKFFSNMVYLHVNYIHITDIESCLRSILEEIHHESHKHLRSLCFHVPAVDDRMIRTLEKMMNDEKLLINYTIKRVDEHIYLQWK